MSELQRALDELRITGEWITHVTSWRRLDARPAQYAEAWPDLDPRLIQMLAAQGIEQLYTHQAQAVRQVLEGRHVVIITPTASGKTLCYHLPILQSLLRDSTACALCIFPTKALAQDQLHILRNSLTMLGLDSGIAATYDGDTPHSVRPQIRRQARILLSNPDMLHAGILPHHVQWRDLFARLRYIVLDELHTYRGVFGSHVANILRRLMRICHFYGSRPQFILCSATIANPDELAQRLIGQPVSVVSHSGAPRGELAFVFYNPPIVDQRLGLRRSTLAEACGLANHLLNHDVQTVIFGRSRLSVELALTQLHQDARRFGRDARTIRGYRGGYLPGERRHIEQGIREGTVRGIVATNALELGVDIGGLEASIMAGYPGTISSTWQQAGRAGRRNAQSVAVLVASSSPLDQYIVAHPDYFFGQSPERALINPDNLHVLVSHVKCALFELPFGDDERFGERDIREILTFLQESGLARHTRGAWHWTGDQYPAAEISLRAADPHCVSIIEQDDQSDRRTIGQLDRPNAPLFLHEGAIYLHEGQQYLVESLDWEAGIANVRPVSVDYYTEATASSRIVIERTLAEYQHPNLGLAYGDVTVTTRFSSYRRMRFGSLEHLGWGQINLPEQQLFTTACWLMVPNHVVQKLQEEGWWMGEHIESRGPSWPAQRERARKRDGYRCRVCGASERPGHQHDVHHIIPFREFKWIPGENENHVQANHLSNLITLCPSCHRRAEQQIAVQSTLAALSRVLGHLIPLWLMCDPHDIGMLSDIQAPQTGLPTIFIYDQIPGGIGLCEQIPHLYAELLSKAAELVRDCPCASGCPSCIGPTGETNDRPKQQLLRLIAALQSTSPYASTA